MDTTMLQLTVQSGCAHLIMDLLVGTGGTSGEKAGGADCVEAGPTDGRSVVASGTVFPALKGTPPPQQQQQQPTVDPFLDTNTGTSLVSTSDLGPPLGYALASGSNSGLHTRQASRDAGMSTTSSLSLEPTPTAASTQQMEQQRLLLQQVQLPDKAPADTGGVVWKRLMDGGLHELLQALRGGGGGEQGLSAAGDGRGGADSPIGDSKTQRVLLQFEDKVGNGCTIAGPSLRVAVLALWCSAHDLSSPLRVACGNRWSAVLPAACVIPLPPWSMGPGPAAACRPCCLPHTLQHQSRRSCLLGPPCNCLCCCGCHPRPSLSASRRSCWSPWPTARCDNSLAAARVLLYRTGSSS